MKKFLSALAFALALAAPLSAQQKFRLFTQVAAKPGGTTGDLFYVSDTSGTITRLPAAATQGQCLLSTGTPILPAWGACAAGGTVTSVGLSLPGTLFSVSGSPVTGSGTLSGALLAQSANTVFAGPASGGSSAPTFRAIIPADVPVFLASGVGHAAGLVPDPGASAGTTRFLREDATWQTPAGGVGHTIEVSGTPFTARTNLDFLLGFDGADNAGADSTEISLDLSEVAAGGDLTWSTNTPTIANDAVTFGKFQNIATSRLLGRATAATGDVEEITLGTNLSFTGTTLNAAGGGGGDSTTAGTYASRPAASNDGNIHIATDSPLAYRDNGTAWTPFGPIFTFTDATTPSWSWDNQPASATVDTTKGGIVLYQPSNASGSIRMAAYGIAVPSTPYTITAAFILTTLQSSTGVGPIAGLYWRDSGATPKYVNFQINADNTDGYLQAQKETSATAFSANYKSISGIGQKSELFSGSVYWMRIRDDGTNRLCLWSRDGQNWVQFHTIGNTDFLTPTRIGFHLSTGADYDAYMWLLSWKQE